MVNNLPKQTQSQTSKINQTTGSKQAIKADYKVRRVVVELQATL